MSSLKPEYADVLVNMGEWAKVSGEQTIATQGLGPCIGLALYDCVTRTGYMAHTYAAELDIVDKMLAHVAIQTPKSTSLRAWLGGGQLTTYEGETYYDDVREDTAQRLVDLGLLENKVEINWSDNSDEIIDMILDCSSGECRFIVDKIEDVVPLFDLEDD